MIECIFTLDYEIYGNGTGSLSELVFEPASKLDSVFRRWNARFVAFVEVAELEKIEAWSSDPAIDQVKQQIRDLYQNNFEIALHLHPQWCNGRFEQGRWVLDASEYNLCRLAQPRIVQIVERSLAYLRHLVDTPSFTPLSFRAGNWLFQPTLTAASVLAQNGIRIDSSVFKGGLQHNHDLDYRPALRNGYYWTFERDVNEIDPVGTWIEVPIFTRMVPVWQMPTAKRLSLGNSFGEGEKNVKKKWNRAVDFLRFRYPLKLDFCRMTLVELTSVMNSIIREDQANPSCFRPIVAIGHTKDLTDLDTVESFLAYLAMKKIKISTFNDVYSTLRKLTFKNASDGPTSSPVQRLGIPSKADFQDVTSSNL